MRYLEHIADLMHEARGWTSGCWSMGLRIKLSEADAVTVQSPILVR